MPFITALKKQAKRNRVNVFLDGTYSFALELEECVRLGLKVGNTLTESEIETITQTDKKQKLLTNAIGYLSYRPRSEKEIRNHLFQKYCAKKNVAIPNVVSGDIDDVIERLKKNGALNEQSFAEWWVEQRTQFKPKGIDFIKRELVAKGIASEIIEAAVAKQKEEGGKSELENAKNAIAKKMTVFNKLPNLKRQQKIAQFLRYRGYSWETIKEISRTGEPEELA